jgi:hypothetical protein
MTAADSPFAPLKGANIPAIRRAIAIENPIVDLMVKVLLAKGLMRISVLVIVILRRGSGRIAARPRWSGILPRPHRRLIAASSSDNRTL